MARNQSVSELLGVFETLPPRTLFEASALADMLRPIADAGPAVAPVPLADPKPLTWRERLWLVPAETRLGRDEVLEAFGRPKSWLYRHTSAGTIPHRKLDGELVFIAGELRAWARDREEVVSAGRMESTESERHLRLQPAS